MELPDPKQLKKLADFCRKAGVKSYECAEFKITLDDSYAPAPSAYQRRKAAKVVGGKPGQAKKDFIQGTDVPIDYPSAEELLFLSAGGPPDGFDPQDIPQ